MGLVGGVTELWRAVVVRRTGWGWGGSACGGLGGFRVSEAYGGGGGLQLSAAHGGAGGRQVSPRTAEAAGCS